MKRLKQLLVAFALVVGVGLAAPKAAHAQSMYVNGIPACDYAFEQIDSWNAMQTNPYAFLNVIGGGWTGQLIPGTSWGIYNYWGLTGGYIFEFSCFWTY